MIALHVLLFLVLGAMAGIAYVSMVAKDAQLVIQGGVFFTIIGLRLARLLLFAIIFVIGARQGWPALLAATIGFRVMWKIVLRLQQEAT